MANCPHCGNEIIIPARAEHNVDTYGKSAITVTLCCGRGVRVNPIRSFSFAAFESKDGVDDWGYPFGKVSA